ncbi:apolipoprotein N-acyltransferase [Pilimelia columellifera]|uniref:Apolipoprotein N-acyltransferase n=1 Tax=Pilimelia columellifera subsp. columellifera TaxID=706583 RepID=A0ABP6AW57_9ACTN
MQHTRGASTRRWAAWAPLAAAVAAGAALIVALPPYGLWWLAPVGVALLAFAATGRGVRAGAGLGLVAGVVFFTPVLSWTNLHTGALPWLLLSACQAVYFAGLGALTALSTPLVDRWRWMWAPLTATLWVAQEAARDRTPFGGFPWARLAFTQDESPLLYVASLGGAPAVTFAVALAGGLLAAGVRAAWRWRAGRDEWVALAATAGALAGLFAGSAAAARPRPQGPTSTVAIVQGNVPRLGLDFNAQRRAVLDNHVNATTRLAAEVTEGRADQPDLVVWPENSSDIDPLRNADAAAVIDRAARAIGAPILVGAVLLGPGPDQVRNAGILWRPVGGPDLEQLYVKRHPVPFAEYVPLRGLARMVSAEVDRVRFDFVPGDRPGVVRAGGVVVGDVICFEVAYDEVVRDTVLGGAQVLAVQTNNATFNSAEARQQLAMVRLRAVEHGRDALMASTVGVSAFVDGDGRVVGATRFNTDAVVLHEVRAGRTRTLATSAGYWPEAVLVAMAAAGVFTAVVLRRRGPAGRDGDGARA